jgi:hypothetical protein
VTNVLCKCDRCGCEALSIPDKEHRRCSGNPKTTPRPKRDKLPSEKRGKWQPVA